MNGLTEHVLSADYEAKQTSYFTNPRRDYVDLLPANPAARILELGCGSGATGQLALQSGKAGYYAGIEVFEPMADRARTVLSEVLVGDVERMELPDDLTGFDALIMSEVLEHLTNPEAAVAELVSRLKPGALIFASSPNIAYWGNIRSLIRGRFDYTDSGMMDRTHLKWFTPYSFEKMFNEAGVETLKVGPIAPPGRKMRLLMKLIPAIWPMPLFPVNFLSRYKPFIGADAQPLHGAGSA